MCLWGGLRWGCCCVNSRGSVEGVDTSFGVILSCLTERMFGIMEVVSIRVRGFDCAG
jgi:hypothetical protein